MKAISIWVARNYAVNERVYNTWRLQAVSMRPHRLGKIRVARFYPVSKIAG